ncbi:MAG TPA: hypothetical protein VG317_11280 [Pseudonocardiaceae bacterium]|nr:hypothetical protein [Pseudonocardiaceae bacterium]
MPTVTAGHRLMDLIMLLHGDHRVQTLFTVPRVFGYRQGPEDFVQDHRGLLEPWPHALQQRYDLILSAGDQDADHVCGNVLALSHGAGSLKSRRFSRMASNVTRETTGLDREMLTFRGRVVPQAIALSHDDELDVLRRTCPEAVDRAVVAGDICFDRMIASCGLRSRYRRALGVRDDQTLVTVSSTWSPDSTFGQHITVYRRLLDELPADQFRVAAVLHPNIWAVHGRWQVRAWLADCLTDGLLVIPPEEGWRATMIAADWVLGDHGSTTVYAAALGKPVTLAAFPEHNVRPGSLADHVARHAPGLRHDRPLLPQLRAAASAMAPTAGPAVAGALTSKPGESARILRATMYSLLGLPEPAGPAVVAPLPDPRPITAITD